MIDWYNLLMNALWIFACALALSTISYVSWQASALGEKFRTVLGKRGIQVALNSAGLLFCIGLAGTSDVLWQRVLWILLAVGFVLQIGVEFYQRRNTN
jgi:mannose/fructose/N-acetylgalactosamine-specific phosphotransferase system component IIC